MSELAIKRFVKLPSVQNVVAGSDFSLDIPVGGVIYHNLTLALTNITLAQLEDLELRINGKPVQKFATGSELDAINKYHGRGASNNGFLTMHFSRPELNLLAERVLTALSTGDVATLSLHGTINAAAASPAIIAYADQELGNKPLGMITKVKRFPYSSSVTGQVEISNIPRSGGRIPCIHLVKDDISAVEVDVNSVRFYEASKTLGTQKQLEAGKTAQTSLMTHVDFCLAGTLADSLRTKGVADLRIRPTFDTTGSVTVVVEYLDALAGI